MFMKRLDAPYKHLRQAAYIYNTGNYNGFNESYPSMSIPASILFGV